MAASIQQGDALALLDALMPIVEAGGAPLRGYDKAAELIGRKYSDSRHIGQVTSRLDLAAFYAGLPMLAMHWIRKPDGAMNPASFSGEPWSKFQVEMAEAAERHKWTGDELVRLRSALINLPDASVLLQWKLVEDREYARPGFIAYDLHRQLKG